MADFDIAETIVQGRTGRILEAITNAEAVLGRNEVDFPRIAVFGDESSGKSSMLESICRIPFPQGNTTTTRCPTILRLERVPSAEWSASAWICDPNGNRTNQMHANNPEELESIIAELQGKLLSGGSSANFSADPVTVNVRAPDAVDLTLVDLPGYFTHEGLKSGGSGAIQLVKESLLSFLSDPNTIALVVVPADQLVKTINIFNLLKDYEKTLPPDRIADFHSRTIYCFTKCDRVAGDQEKSGGTSYNIEEILYNKGAFAAEPHGWYAVVNKRFDSDFSSRLIRSREYERDFFDRTLPYRKRDLRNRCGTDNLIEKLSMILTSKIGEKIPTMLAQTNDALAKSRTELKSLGPEPIRSENETVEFRTIIDHIKMYFVSATNGEYGGFKSRAEDSADPLSPEDLDRCKLAYRKYVRCLQFAKEIQACRSPLDDPKYLAELQKKVEHAVDGRFDYTIPVPEVLFEEVSTCAKKWRTFAETLCDEVADAAIDCLHKIVSVTAGIYLNLPNVLNEHLELMIEEQRVRATNRINWHYVDEIMRPNTQNPLFEKEIDALRNLPGLGKNREGTRNAYVANLKAYFPIAEARFIDNVVRTVTTHLFDVPGGHPLASVTADNPPKHTFLTLDIGEDQDIADVMKIRDDLSDRRKHQEDKVRVLEELRSALRDLPISDAVGSSKTDPPKEKVDNDSHKLDDRLNNFLDHSSGVAEERSQTNNDDYWDDFETIEEDLEPSPPPRSNENGYNDESGSQRRRRGGQGGGERYPLNRMPKAGRR